MRASLNHMHTLPELVMRQDSLLWSINERLAGREGRDLAPLGTDWLHDVCAFDAETDEEWDELRANAPLRRREEDEF